MKLLPVSEGVQQSLLVIFGNFIAYGFAALSLLLITRALGPVRFGEFSVGFALLLILNKLNDMGMTASIHKFASQNKEPQIINNIFSFTIKVKILGALLIAVIGLISHSYIAEVLHFDNANIILAAFLVSGATVMYEQLQAMLQSLHLFTQSVAANIIQASVKLLGGLSLLIVPNIGTLPIFLGYASAPLLPIFLLKYFFPSWLHIKLQNAYTKEKHLLLPLARHSAIGLVSIGLIENIDILFVQHYLTTYDAGLLGGVSRVALLFNLVAYSLSTVLNPRVAKYRSLFDLRSYIKKAWLVAVATAIGFILYLPFSTALITYSIGPEYIPGSQLLTILMAAAFIGIAVIPFAALFFSFDHHWYFSISGIVQLAIILVGNSVFIPIYGLEATVWTRLVAKVALLVFTIILAFYLLQKKEKGIYSEAS